MASFGPPPILLARRLPRMRGARSTYGPKILAVPSPASVDLPRSQAMSYAAGIEATETSATISDADMDDLFAASRITRSRRRLADSAKSEAASGTRWRTSAKMIAGTYLNV